MRQDNIDDLLLNNTMGEIKDWLIKKQYCKQLQTEGYDAPRIIKTPADIIATKNGEIWWFKILYTTVKDLFSRELTETEREQAYNDPEHFRFVVIQTDKLGTKITHKEYFLNEFISYYYIPQFKCS